MKKCKFCNAELAENSTLCPGCGKDNAQAPKKSGLANALLIAALAVALVVIVSAALFGIRSTDATVQTGETIVFMDDHATDAAQDTTQSSAGETQAESAEETQAPTVPADGNPEDITCKGTYTADDDTVIAARDTIVATAGEYELTLGQLQAFYWMEFRNFATQYGAYIDYFGLDLMQSLDTQTCAMIDPPVTWQQFFLQSALNSWMNYQAMAAEAEAHGYTLTQAQREELDNAEEALDAVATANGFESGAAMVHSSLGPAAEIEDYAHFMELYYTAYGYYAQLLSEIQPTEEELEAYFDEHAEGYASNGITKDTTSVDVRHILLYPEGADGTNLSTGEFSEEAWAAAEASAQKLLDEFLAGETTEESFAALANEHSQDPGSNTNGGLYEDVVEGEMVQAFNDWCFDETRKVGDTGIVKTNYGYHVMYFSGSAPLWKAYAQSDYVTEAANNRSDAIAARYPLTVEYGNILLAEANIY